MERRKALVVRPACASCEDTGPCEGPCASDAPSTVRVVGGRTSVVNVAIHVFRLVGFAQRQNKSVD
jgi:hypothetical protein